MLLHKEFLVILLIAILFCGIIRVSKGAIKSIVFIIISYIIIIAPLIIKSLLSIVLLVIPWLSNLIEILYMPYGYNERFANNYDQIIIFVTICGALFKLLVMNILSVLNNMVKKTTSPKFIIKFRNCIKFLESIPYIDKYVKTKKPTNTTIKFIIIIIIFLLPIPIIISGYFGIIELAKAIDTSNYCQKNIIDYYNNKTKIFEFTLHSILVYLLLVIGFITFLLKDLKKFIKILFNIII